MRNMAVIFTCGVRQPKPRKPFNEFGITLALGLHWKLSVKIYFRSYPST